MARKSIINIHMHVKKMFKFVSGMLLGWTAARVLPPKPSDVSPWQPPSTDEWRLLAGHVVKTFEYIRNALEENSND